VTGAVGGQGRAAGGAPASLEADNDGRYGPAWPRFSINYVCVFRRLAARAGAMRQELTLVSRQDPLPMGDAV